MNIDWTLGPVIFHEEKCFALLALPDDTCLAVIVR